MYSPPKIAPSSAELAKAIEVADREQAGFNHEAAVAIYRTVLAQIPEYIDGHAKHARALFCLRRWDEAWPAFDVRFKLMDPPVITGRNRDGSARNLPRHTNGKLPERLLVLAEQGLGDTIQFCRFLPRLVAAGVDVQAVVPQKLFGLLRTLDPPLPILPSEGIGSAVGVETWTMMMDLPRLLGLKEEDYLAKEPYLRADPQRVAHWRSWCDETFGDNEGPVIGFVWRGNPEHKLDGSRSAKLEDFAPLADIPGARLLCLQFNPTAEELAACSFADKIVCPPPEFDKGPDSFIDTAAILQSIDRTVCVDTSIVHIAGALHCPADLMLTHKWADWRWLDREDMNVWYPTVRLNLMKAGQTYRDVAARVAQRIMQPDAD